MGQQGIPRWLFWLIAASGAASLWLAPHPPMIDLPQHAGQLALLRQLLTGDGRWAPLFQINPYTPYLIGLGLALPLTTVMPIAAAMKLMLSLAYLAFVAACVALRKHFGADVRLDALALCSFFGFAFHWGFFTFLTAAPLGLFFILLASRQAQRPAPGRAVGLALLGLLLLVSHGLVFLFSWAAAAGVLLLGTGRIGAALKAGWPLLVSLAGCVAYFFARGPAEAAFAVAPTVPGVMWQLGIRHEVFGYAFGLVHQPLSVATAALMGLAPWLMGLRLNRRPAAWVPFALVAVVLCAVPSFLFETSFVYQRFALFLFPTYAWLFTAPAAAASTTPAARASRWVPLALTACCAAVLAQNGWRTWRFGQEEADFRAVSATLEPGQRALALIFDPSSAAQGDGGVYVHHALWYQVEQQGLVDFNFAWVQPQIVRYRVAARPPVALDFAWRPQRFDWQRHRGEDYRYFFVRGGPAAPAALFPGAPCLPRLLAEQGRWQVYERSSCLTRQ